MRSMRVRAKLYHCRAVGRDCDNRQTLRRRNGSQIVEFAAAIILLIGFVAVPCLDLAIVPIRWIMAQQLIESYVRTLAMCETFTESLHTLDTDPSLTTRLVRLGGVRVESLNLTLKITRVLPDQTKMQYLDVRVPGQIPAAWLPNGAFAPCTYALHIDARLSIAPAVLMTLQGLTIPGLTAPIPVLLHASHEWMNLEQDPNTEKFRLNE
jgi:hypothetical protein